MHLELVDSVFTLASDTDGAAEVRALLFKYPIPSCSQNVLLMMIALERHWMVRIWRVDLVSSIIVALTVPVAYERYEAHVDSIIDFFRCNQLRDSNKVFDEETIMVKDCSPVADQDSCQLHNAASYMDLAYVYEQVIVHDALRIQSESREPTSPKHLLDKVKDYIITYSVTRHVLQETTVATVIPNDTKIALVLHYCFGLFFYEDGDVKRFYCNAKTLELGSLSGDIS
ncbi:hypothetical protein L1987_26494 [Smallanthus sonchifolius]|uniref:Uncharacterized protein n=1 Tax=Smallanthus sonchifolius TaxID=185202 RepID=A0ACB9IB46_9ASTR|nr:hypothetical protein L1987_26494 [Smallanthus sonchifolius]